MGKIIIIGANGAVGKSCASKLNDKELVLISRSKFDDSTPKNSNIIEHVLDLNDYAKTSDLINKIDYEISGIIVFWHHNIKMSIFIYIFFKIHIKN